MKKITKRQLNFIKEKEKTLGIKLEVNEDTSELEAKLIIQGLKKYKIK